MNKLANLVMLAFLGFVLYALYNALIMTNLWHDIYYYLESWVWSIEHILK